MAAPSRAALVVGMAGALGALGSAVGAGAAHGQPRVTPSPPSQPPPMAAVPLLQRADALAAEIAALRGLPLRAPLQKEVVDKAELRRRLIAMTARPKEALQLVREERMLKLWGLLPAALDYRAMLLDVLSDQIAGYYDGETKRLTLTDDPAADPEWSELVLTHEIQHALQDQTFPLEKFRDVPTGEDDSAMARLALIEGDGMAVMLTMAAGKAGHPMPWSDAEVLQSLALALAESTEPVDEQVPLVVREQLAFPYRAGFAFVAELRRQQPWRVVDAAFRRPPLSTEQILHPALYVKNELPLRVGKLALSAETLGLLALPTTGRQPAASPATSPTGAAADPTIETVWGELGFSLFLRHHGVTAEMAAKAAAGWGGDRVTAIGQAPDGELVGVARMRWDSEADAREAQEAATRAMDRLVFGIAYDQGPDRTAWMDGRGRVSFVERRGDDVVLGHQIPVRAARRLTEEAWKSLAAPLPAATPRGPRPRAR